MGYEKFKIKHGHDYSRQRLICLIIIIVTASHRNVCSRAKIRRQFDIFPN